MPCVHVCVCVLCDLCFRVVMGVSLFQLCLFVRAYLLMVFLVSACVPLAFSCALPLCVLMLLYVACMSGFVCVWVSSVPFLVLFFLATASSNENRQACGGCDFNFHIWLSSLGYGFFVDVYNRRLLPSYLGKSTKRSKSLPNC